MPLIMHVLMLKSMHASVCGLQVTTRAISQLMSAAAHCHIATDPALIMHVIVCEAHAAGAYVMSKLPVCACTFACACRCAQCRDDKSRLNHMFCERMHAPA